MPEAACTSTQLHLQVSPDNFAAYWNASQAIAGVQLAVGANSPVPARQASCGARPASRCSSRPPTPAARSSRSRACGRGCGSASAGSPRSSTCSRRTCATSRRCCRSATTRTRSRCSRRAAPRSSRELQLHNGTIYRWNRPVYDVVEGVPHLRVENRVLPAGPTRGRHDGQRRVLLRPGPRPWPRTSGRCGRRCRSPPPRRTSTSRPGTASTARLYWPGVGEVRRHRAGAAPAAADGARRAWTPGASSPTRRPAARHHRAALRARPQRRLLVRRPDRRPGGEGPRPARRRCG